MIGTLPTELFWVCNWCKTQKSGEAFPKNSRGSFGIGKTCKDCYNAAHAAKTKARDKSRIKKQLMEAPYMAIDRMLREDSEFLMQVVNLNSRWFRSEYEKAKVDIIEKLEKQKVAYLMRPQNQGDTLAKARAARLEKKWVAIGVSD